MADKQQQDRTEQPTAKRRADARRKGDVPRSRELTMTAVMLSGAAGILALSEPIGERILATMREALTIERSQVFDVSYPVPALATIGGNALVSLLPLGLLLIAATVGGAALLGGWSFSASGMAFKGGRLNPLKGIKRIFSANSLNELAKAIAKFSIVATAAVAWLWSSRDVVLGLGRLPVNVAIVEGMKLCALSFLVVSATLIAIAAVDVPFQLWSYTKKLRMTRQEIKDEFKDTEGRPEVKSRIRTLQQQIATRRMMEEVPTADVVVTNPTHFAVAIRYVDGRMRAPKVVAKGKNLVAARIREIAAENDVPLYSAPPLARALYSSTKLGQEIPAALYTAVAQVLAYVFQVRDLQPGGAEIAKPALVDIDEEQFR